MMASLVKRYVKHFAPPKSGGEKGNWALEAARLDKEIKDLQFATLEFVIFMSIMPFMVCFLTGNIENETLFTLTIYWSLMAPAMGIACLFKQFWLMYKREML